jgi:DNA invertase Pin-like site-specific DNA recombinase
VTLKYGDTIVMTKLDLNTKEVSLVILNIGGDVSNTSTAIGKLMITVLSGIAEIEVDMFRERQLEGIEMAKQQGIYKGRTEDLRRKSQRIATCY